MHKELEGKKKVDLRINPFSCLKVSLKKVINWNKMERRRYFLKFIKR